MRSVIFDLGGVVLDWSPARLVERLEPDPQARAALLRATVEHEDWLALDRGTLEESVAIRRFAARAARPETDLVRFMDAVREFLQPVPPVIELLRSLAARGVPLYCLSNMQAAVGEHLLRVHEFWPLFRGIVLSAHVGLIKPERAIFELILDCYELDPAATAFVDDHPPNIEAARALGLHAIRFVDPGQCRRELEFWLEEAE
jgi:putative hydrolase of the HAD superfamily